MTATITRVDQPGGQSFQPSETTTLTIPLSDREIGETISEVVARGDREYALDLITVLQIKTRLAEDTGERITLDEFARQEGFDLDEFRS